MPTLDDVYRKFGETAEAAQLLETELGTKLLIRRGVAANLHNEPNSALASDISAEIDRHTLGQLIKGLTKTNQTAEAAQLLETELGTNFLLNLGVPANLLNQPNSAIDALESLLLRGLQERNRLSHSFYRQHNFRRNTDHGRALMLEDLESILDTLLEAYKAVVLLSGVDLDALVEAGVEHVPPTLHVQI